MNNQYWKLPLGRLQLGWAEETGIRQYGPSKDVSGVGKGRRNRRIILHFGTSRFRLGAE